MATRLLWSGVIVFLVASASLVASCVRVSCHVYSSSGMLPTGMPRYRDSFVTSCTARGAGRPVVVATAAGFSAITNVLFAFKCKPDANAKVLVRAMMIATSTTDRT
ncbi:hypothetical protein PF008_g26831 [Phytophthora fragariae]|uniref:Subtilisin n=1 Tax=Phytophthora fragariae TaxID=53985 RepID=A0A6G0QGS7_9STRA|nr:hypothetical protein PF008_g26831 [Phytophthora fragariae]